MIFCPREHVWGAANSTHSERGSFAGMSLISCCWRLVQSNDMCVRIYLLTKVLFQESSTWSNNGARAATMPVFVQGSWHSWYHISELLFKFMVTRPICHAYFFITYGRSSKIECVVHRTISAMCQQRSKKQRFLERA